MRRTINEINHKIGLDKWPSPFHATIDDEESWNEKNSRLSFDVDAATVNYYYGI